MIVQNNNLFRVGKVSAIIILPPLARGGGSCKATDGEVVKTT